MVAKMKPVPPSAFIRGRLGLVPAGGRTMPLFSGYRAMIWRGEMDGDLRLPHDAVVFLETEEEIKPGGEANVRLQPLDPDAWTDVESGDELELYEGKRLVGRLRVLELFPSS